MYCFFFFFVVFHFWGVLFVLGCVHHCLPPVSRTNTHHRYVQEVNADGAWIVFSPTCRGRCHVLDAADNPVVLQTWPRGFAVGQRVQCTVLRVTASTLDVGMRGGGQVLEEASVGSLLMGRIKAAEGAGILVQLGPRTMGKVGGREGNNTSDRSTTTTTKIRFNAFIVVNKDPRDYCSLDGLFGIGACTNPHTQRCYTAAMEIPDHIRRTPQVALTDLHDSWVVNALQGIQVGSFVRAKLLQAGSHPLLSMRAQDGALWGTPPIPEPVAADSLPPTTLDAAMVKVGWAARGYVKAVTKAGVFVVLARDVEARVRLSQLQNGFVEDPATAFPVGSLFTGRVVATEGGRYACLTERMVCIVLRGVHRNDCSQAGAVCAHIHAHARPFGPGCGSGGTGQGRTGAAVWCVYYAARRGRYGVGTHQREQRRICARPDNAVQNRPRWADV